MSPMDCLFEDFPRVLWHTGSTEVDDHARIIKKMRRDRLDSQCSLRHIDNQPIMVMSILSTEVDLVKADVQSAGKHA